MGFLVNPYIHGALPGFLLDTYSASSAYSLRQLKTGVTSVIRVRRSSDNAESDFTATEITNGTLTTFTGASDGYITTYYDQVGSNDWTQTTGTEQFKIVSSGSLVTNTDGNVSAESVGNHYLLTTAWSETQEMTMLMIGEQTSQRYTSLGNSSTSQFVSQQFGTNNITTRLGSSNLTWSSSVATNSISLLTIIRDSSDNMYLYIDSASDSLNPQISALDNTYDYEFFGRFHNTQAFNGYFNELILFESDESSNRTAIESDINTYYSIY